MLLLKIIYRINSSIKKIFYKIIYRNSVKFGRNVVFRKGFSLVIEKGASVEIGDGCFFNNYCSINAMNKINIGSNCLFGENVKMYDHNHIFKFKDELIKNQGFKTGEIVIRENCWISSNSIILKGTDIGSNTVIAAGEIIDRKISEGVVVKNNIEKNIEFSRR